VELGVTADWIVERTGIKSRHFVTAGESASFLSAQAGKQALERAGVKASDLGWIIGCTASGDYVFPAMACKVQALLGAHHAGAFDLSAGSTGFQVGLDAAWNRLRCDSEMTHVLVIGTAVQSPYLDWGNPKVSILFGDGSGAAVVSRVPRGYGALASNIFCDPGAFEAVRLRGGGSSHPLRSDNVNQGLQFIEMDGGRVGRAFLKYQPIMIEQALKKAGLLMKEVDLFIFHQANSRLIRFLMSRMKVSMSKTYTNGERIGNNSDASLSIALCEEWEQNLIRRNSIVVLSGVGAGCVFGATVLRWH